MIKNVFFQKLFFVFLISALVSCTKTIDYNPVEFREPYLQYESGDSLAVRWFTKSELDRPMVSWNGTFYMSKTIDHRYGVIYESIVPITDYENQYILYNGSEKISDVYTTSTLDANFGEYKFFAVGDIGQPSSKGGFTHELNSLINSIDSLQLGIWLGDIVYFHGRSSDYDDYFFEPLAQSLSSIITVPILGNHDYYSAIDDNYFQEWKRIDNGHYFKIVKDNSLFIFLDSKNGRFYKYEEQKQWLEKTLQSAQEKYDWIFVSLHHNGRTATYKREYKRVIELYPLFAKYKVDLVLNGHSHTYERLKPMDRNGNVFVTESTSFYDQKTMNNSFISITAGAGGKLNGHSGVDDSSEKFKEYVAKAVHVGHLPVFSVRGKVLECKVYNQDVELIDSFTINKE
ncbi:MAG: metallophosphoesterase [Flavobacteriales bacterium]|nr:metallophosphoesterase [Flavobacteriales bacterium]